MRLLVCGDRNWDDYKRILSQLEHIGKSHKIDVLIEGGQTSWNNVTLRKYGADHQAKIAAMELGIPVMEFPANWHFHNNSAGPIRNGWMLKFGEPDLVLAFHSDIKHSKGTKNMVMQAKKKGIKVKIIK